MAEDVVKVKKTDNKKSNGKKGWFKQLKAEFKKIIWTDRKTLAKQTVAVIVISAILCVLITLIDSGALALIEMII
jgi:preprotein translocase subunit SecE